MSTDQVGPEPIRTWKPLGAPSPGALLDARLELHWASQLVGAVGVTRLEPMPGYRHHALTWSEDRDAAITPVVRAEEAYQAGLAPASGELLLLDGDGHEVGAKALAGTTLEEGLGWLGEAISLFAGPSDKPLAAPDHEMPAHRVVDGEPFAFEDVAASGELARWFSNADAILQAVRADDDRASEVLLWPHHFDMAVLIALDSDPEKGRSINVGFSPGDDGRAEPYLYVTPWPKPAQSELPELAYGNWNTEGWVGALLTGSEVCAAGGGPEQGQLVSSFVGGALRAAHDLLGG